MTDIQFNRLLRYITSATILIALTLSGILIRIDSAANYHYQVSLMGQDGISPRTLTLDTTFAAQQPHKPTYHIIDTMGMQTFTPHENIICYWVDIGRIEGNSQRSAPNITTRSSGLSCVYVSDEDYESYLDRYPR